MEKAIESPSTAAVFTRLNAECALPAVLQGAHVSASQAAPGAIDEAVRAEFPLTSARGAASLSASDSGEAPAIRVGVVLSGGQASGGHNVIAGLYDALKRANPASEVVGFLDGPAGVYGARACVLTAADVARVRNMGGFELLGSGRHKIESEEHKQAALEACRGLAGLVVIGGDDSNTNALVLGEYFAARGGPPVVGVPKTIDGDLKTERCELSFGFDTACRVFAEQAGALNRKAQLENARYSFVKVMGRAASNIALEVALHVRPAVALISEEVREQGLSLRDVVTQICEVVDARAERGIHGGVVLIPEGLIEFIPEVGTLIQSLNRLVLTGELEEKLTQTRAALGAADLAVWSELPEWLQRQLLADRDPHGNVQVSLIETEKLLGALVKQQTRVKVHYAFLGYEGRCAMPSLFDATYCYALGATAAALVRAGCNGCMAVVGGLARTRAGPEGLDVSDWEPAGAPLAEMVHYEERHGKQKPVIKKFLVDSTSEWFQDVFVPARRRWAEDHACARQGLPIQYLGPFSTLLPWLLCPPTLDELLETVSWNSPMYGLPGAGPVQGPDGTPHPGTYADFVHAFGRGTDRLVQCAPAEGPPRLAVVLVGAYAPGVAGAIAALLQTGAPWSLYESTKAVVEGRHATFAGPSRPHAQAAVEQARWPAADALIYTGLSDARLAAKSLVALGIQDAITIGGRQGLEHARLLAQGAEIEGVPLAVRHLCVSTDRAVVTGTETVGLATATEATSAFIANLQSDCLSSKKYWYVARVPGAGSDEVAAIVADHAKPDVALLARRGYASISAVASELADTPPPQGTKPHGVAILDSGALNGTAEMGDLLLNAAQLCGGAVQSSTATTVIDSETSAKSATHTHTHACGELAPDASLTWAAEGTRAALARLAPETRRRALQAVAAPGTALPAEAVVADTLRALRPAVAPVCFDFTDVVQFAQPARHDFQTAFDLALEAYRRRGESGVLAFCAPHADAPLTPTLVPLSVPKGPTHPIARMTEVTPRTPRGTQPAHMARACIQV